MRSRGCSIFEFKHKDKFKKFKLNYIKTLILKYNLKKSKKKDKKLLKSENILKTIYMDSIVSIEYFVIFLNSTVSMEYFVLFLDSTVSMEYFVIFKNNIAILIN